MAAGSSYAWPSVVVYKGARQVQRRTIVKCDWSDNFGAILERLGDDYSNEIVTQVVISSNERLVDPAHTVPLDAPVKLLETYGCHYVGFYLADSSTAPAEEAQEQQPQNALTILMQNAGRIMLPPASVGTTASSSSGCDQQLRGDQRLRNDYLQYLQDRKVGWSPGIVSSTGEQFVRIMTSALWYLDPHHQQLMDR